MLKSFLTSTIILLGFSLLESAILSNIVWLPVVPDFMLICVLYFSVHNGRLLGETTGFVSGLLLDFLSSCPFGLNCLLRTCIGFIGGMFNKTLNTDGFIMPAVLGFFATLIKCLLLWIISFFFPKIVFAYNIFSVNFLMEVLLNAILTPVVFKFLTLFHSSLIIDPEKTI